MTRKKPLNSIHIDGPFRETYLLDVQSLLDRNLPEAWDWVEGSVSSIIAKRISPPVVYFKEYLSRSPLEDLKSFFRGSRCGRAWKQGQILLKRGFWTPSMHCWGNMGPRGFMVFEGIEGQGMGDFAIQNWTNLHDSKTLLKKRNIVEKLGQEIGRLHSAGIFHGDLRPNNILIQHRENEIHFYFLDNERNRLFRKIPVNLIQKNLIQINMILSSCMTLTDRLRFFRAYEKEFPRFSPGERKRLLKIIHKKSMARLKKYNYQ